MSDWRAEAREAIIAALVDGRSLGLDGAALVGHVDARYPFGARVNHPYRIWLDERKTLLRGLLPPKSEAREPPPFDREAPR